RVHAVAEADPAQQVDDLLAIARLAAAHHAERQRDVLVGGHVVEQPEILQHDADAPSQIGDLVLAELGDVMAEQIDQAAGRPVGEEQQAQQRGLAGAGRAGEELEGMRRDLEVEVAQDLRPQTVTQSDIFEPNQAQLRSRGGRRRAAPRPARSAGCDAVMVSAGPSLDPSMHQGSAMHIVCPHCTTSYAIKLSSLGPNGRTVRCSRCKETWVAHPDDAIEEAPVPAMAATAQAADQSDLAEQWNAYAKDEQATETPVVE
ncbi:hypothetical protein KXV85_000749, partial [Aspergillus fumigatus]